MIEIVDDKVYSTQLLTDGISRRAVELSVGDKIYPSVNSVDACKAVASKLKELGYSTNIGQNMYTEEWSVAIVDKKDENKV